MENNYFLGCSYSFYDAPFLFFFLSCIAALLGGEVVVTDLPDRLRLLRKNIETNMKNVSLRGSISATELTWGEDPDSELIDPTPDFGKNSLPQPC